LSRSLLRVIHLPRFFAIGAVFALLVWSASIGTAFAADDFARVSALVDRASAASGAERETLVADALGELEAHPAFDQKAWLEEPLRANPPDLPLAQARLAREAEASAGGPVGFVPNQDPRASLNQVLADARFHPRSWQDDVPAILLPLAIIGIAIANFLWSIIRWPFDRLFELLIAFVTSRAFGPIMAVGAIAVVIAVVTLYRRGLTAILVRQAEVAANREGLPLTAADALAAAGREDALAHYREACHFVLFATLLWIEEKGIARFDRSATNREHLDQLVRVATLPDRRLVGALEPVISRFDRVWYGQSFATADDYRDLLGLAGRVRDALP
jgi:hypothetical protein